jgi:hypothetical protein
VEFSDSEWQSYVEMLDAHRLLIEAWPATDPDLAALRCEHSRHRTLAHLRAAQETWLEAVLLFATQENVRIVRPHPWRLFKDRSYESVPWHEHHAAFLTDRAEWQKLLQQPGLDRNRGGKLSGKVRTIASLTSILVNHEKHHISFFNDRP